MNLAESYQQHPDTPHAAEGPLGRRLSIVQESRRKYPRVACSELDVRVSIRLRGEMRSHRAELIDISTHGAGLSLTRPLSCERVAFLSLTWEGFRIKDLVCTVNNCLQTSKANALLTGYRSGLAFRPSSPLQLDGHETQQQLDALVAALGAAAAR